MGDNWTEHAERGAPTVLPPRILRKSQGIPILSKDVKVIGTNNNAPQWGPVDVSGHPARMGVLNEGMYLVVLPEGAPNVTAAASFC